MNAEPMMPKAWLDPVPLQDLDEGLLGGHAHVVTAPLGLRPKASWRAGACQPATPERSGPLAGPYPARSSDSVWRAIISSSSVGTT